MISIISAFGGQHIQDALYKDMQGQNMVFSLEDCSNGISLIMAVEQHPDVDVIVIGHTVVHKYGKLQRQRVLYCS